MIKCKKCGFDWTGIEAGEMEFCVVCTPEEYPAPSNAELYACDLAMIALFAAKGAEKQAKEMRTACLAEYTSVCKKSKTFHTRLEFWERHGQALRNGCSRILDVLGDKGCGDDDVEGAADKAVAEIVALRAELERVQKERNAWSSKAHNLNDKLEVTQAVWNDYKKVCRDAGAPEMCSGGINRWTQNRLKELAALKEKCDA